MVSGATESEVYQQTDHGASVKSCLNVTECALALGARFYKDFRDLLDRQKDLDGVVIATPDHTHAVIAMAAIRAGKHVYCQKPLTHDVYEARMLTKAAKASKAAKPAKGEKGEKGEASDKAQ